MANNPTSLIVALIPKDDWLNNEASAAEVAGLPVYRFPPLLMMDQDRADEDTTSSSSSQMLELTPEPPSSSGGALVIHRGFMLTGEMYTLVYHELQERYGWRMIVTPEQYERAHYFPNSYPFLSELSSPRAVWTECRRSNNEVITRDNFLQAARVAASWGCQSVVIKDYVKSAKDAVAGGNNKRFMEAPANDPIVLAELAIEFIMARGTRFNRGVVFKEFVPLKKNRDAWGIERATNEWRCFFGPSGCLLSMDRNSSQPQGASKPPDNLVKAASVAAKALGSSYMTIDLAECAAEPPRWIVLEAGDGGVSGPAVDQDIAEHWRTLARCFKPSSLVEL